MIKCRSAEVKDEELGVEQSVGDGLKGRERERGS